MYYFYLDKVLLPIPPSKLQVTVNNQNKTINLMNEGEVNVIKPAGLTTVKFDVLLPMITQYPFAMYKNKQFLDATYFTDLFEILKTDKTVFQFIISRWKYVPYSTKSTKKENVMKTNMTVTLENYAITEDAANAPDILVSLELKQYVKYGTVTKEIDMATGTVKKTTKSTALSKPVPNTYTVKKGDTMWAIAKKLLGDGAKCWNLAKLNNISNPNKIQVGQVLKIQDVKATTAPATSGSSSTSGTKKVISVSIGRKDVTAAVNKTAGAGRILYGGRSSGGGGITEKGNTHSGGSRSIDPKPGRSSGGGGISEKGKTHSGGSRVF